MTGRDRRILPDEAQRGGRSSKRIRALTKKADLHYRQGHVRRAVWSYRKALKLDPNHVPTLVNLGLLYSTLRGKHSTAREMLQQASQLQPENPAVLFNLATLTAQAGDLKEAMNFLERAETLNPSYPDLHYNKAYLYAQNERWDDALREVGRELELNPKSANALAMQKAIKVRIKAA